MAGSNAYEETRIVGKLDNFSGAPERWSEWWFNARACFGRLVVGQGAVDMNMGEAEKPAEAVDGSAMNEDALAASNGAYKVLAQVSGGKALRIMRLVPRGNGLECWRLLVNESEPGSTQGESADIGAPRGWQTIARA